MDYKKLIEPDLKKIATNSPYNRFMIWLANIYLRIACKALEIEEGIKCHNIHISGYNRLDGNVLCETCSLQSSVSGLSFGSKVSISAYSAPAVS